MRKNQSQKQNQPPREVHIYLQVSSACNQKCPFCNRPPSLKSAWHSDLGDVKKKIVSLVKSPGVKRVIFTGGETLMYPHLTEAISIAKKKGFITEIQTNGVLLTPQKSIELKRVGLDIVNFAFHSHKKGINNKLRGVNSGFETIVKNLRYAAGMGFNLHIIHVINSLNYKDLPGFVDFLNKSRLGNFWLNLSLVVPEGWARKNKWIIPRMRDVKPFLQKAMRKCSDNGFKFDVSEIVPLCIVNGFEEHAISTLFRISQLKIVDDYFSGQRDLDFIQPSDEYVAKARQCRTCTMNLICAGFYPFLKELYGTSDFVPRRDDPGPVYKKLGLL